MGNIRIGLHWNATAREAAMPIPMTEARTSKSAILNHLLGKMRSWLKLAAYIEMAGVSLHRRSR